ncbi:MAG: CARDB domain-containing protein [Chloroflexota bacterium]
MHFKARLVATAVCIFLVSCNLPVGQVPATQAPVADVVLNAEVTATPVVPVAVDASSVAPTATLTLTPIPTLTLTPTPCTPTATASVNANVRSGPETAYDIIGALLLGQSATVSGRNDASTWWYIDAPGIYGGHGWIAASVVTTSCLPPVVQVVAAPPLPTTTNTEPAPAGLPDLVAGGMQYWPDPAKNGQPVDIQVRVTNNGTAIAGTFTVVWLSNQSTPGCDWQVQGLGVGQSRDLDCQFTYNGNATASYWTTLIVDSASQVAESNEGNNSRDVTLKVAP